MNADWRRGAAQEGLQDDDAFGKGGVVLLPAVAGACRSHPIGAVGLFQILLPKGSGIS